MNREILFKAKHIHVLPQNEHLDGRWIEGYLSDENYINSPKLGGEFLIDKNTICQYTGLTDKNGKKIWENDILCARGNPNDIYQVRFREFGVMNLEDETITDKVVGWYMKVIPTEDVLSTLAPFNADMPLNEIWVENCGLEALGNVFDNPELLEGGGIDA